MFHHGKKRKIQSIAPAPETEADRKLLRALLKQCDESTIVETLADSLDNASAGEIDTLKCLLEDALVTFEPELHCVRCHESYLDSDNGPYECQIPHSDTQGVAQDSYNEFWAGFECCGKDFSKRDKVCITDEHTTNEDDVVYYGDTPVDEDDEYFAKNKNVGRCEDLGCDVD
ncbi:hypothetical protein FRC08_007343 [Ceratobasidium sp. 394]|nr:hypothetical protein FRC08_007343 [Ceratobasidium sp. 394]KAG9075229.1 hypothetical protein FS749_013128 [Ceratobasidium sp. UAMH 11750]